MEKADRKFWAYILENSAGRYYIGSTDDLKRRLSQHNDPVAGTSKYYPKNGPWKLVWKEALATRGQAMQREKFLKSRKSAIWIRTYLLADRASPDALRD